LGTEARLGAIADTLHVMGGGGDNTAVWVGVVGVLATVAVGLTAIEGVIVASHSGSEWDWTAGLMIAAYVLGFTVVFLVVGLLRRWKWLVGNPEPTPPPPAPAMVNNSHAVRLREAAERWGERLRRWLDPDWALPAYDGQTPDYGGLKSLELHFPDLKILFDQYQSLDNALPKTFLRDVTLEDGRQRREPTTPEGVEALQKRSEAARLVIDRLDEIQGMTRFIVGCSECE
jgi:hypothetical protein